MAETLNDVPVLARFPKSLIERIDAYRRRDESTKLIRSRSGIIRAAVEEYLKKSEVTQ